MSLIDDQQKLFGNDSQAGLDARLKAMQTSNMDTQTGSIGVLNAPGTGTDFDNAEKTSRWAIQDAANKLKYSTIGKTDPRAQSILNAAMTQHAKTFGVDTPSFAEGGKPETAEELLARISGKYNVSNTSQPAPTPAAQPAPAPAQPKPQGGLIQQAANIFSNRAKQIDKAAGYANGGKITGPGTAKSDSIPAIAGSGQPIRVANGERILSVEQDAALERIAEMLGYESVDAMLVALTGKPVGPTMKGGLPAAANGAKIDPEELMKQVAATRNIEYQQPATPTYKQPVQVRPDKSNLQMVGEQSTNDINSVDSVGAKIHHAAKGVLAAVPAALEDAYNAAVPVVAPLFTGKDYEAAGAPSPAAPAAQPAQPVSKLVDAATQPVASNVQAAADSNETDLTGRQGAHMVENNLRDFRDVGSGITAQRGTNGQLNVTNVGTENITDPNKQLVDGSASALLDQKNSTYNPAAQLARMQQMRLASDLTNGQITDPGVKADAAKGLGILAAARAGEAQALQAATQGKTAQMQLDDAQKLQEAYRRYLDPKTDAATRDQLYEYLMLHHGKDPNEVKIATTSLPNPNNPMGPNINQSFAIDRKGRTTDVAAAAKAQAEAAARPSFETYAKAVREHPRFRGQTLTDQQIQEMYRATYVGAK